MKWWKQVVVVTGLVVSVGSSFAVPQVKWTLDIDGAFTNKEIYCAPAVGDLDGDGHSEIIIGASTKALYCCEDNSTTGNIRWSHLFSFRPLDPTIADICGPAGSGSPDGTPEILVRGDNDGSTLYQVYCLNNTTGSVLWSSNVGGTNFNSRAFIGSNSNYPRAD